MAASTASRIAARTPCASSAWSPAAVVPPGDVTAARERLGGVAGLGEQRRRAEQRLADQRGGGGARQADEHAGFGHGLGEQEHIRGTGARESGDRVEVGLGHADDGAHRPEHPLGEIEVRFVGAGAGRDRSGALAHECAGVGHGADDRALAGPGFDVGDRDPGRDRQHQRMLRQDRDAGFERARDVAGLHRDHDDVGVGRRPGRARDDAHPGKALFEDPAALGVDLGDRDRVALPTRVEQPLHQGLAHPTATEEREVHSVRLNGWSERVCRPARPVRRGVDAWRVRGTLPSPRTSPNGVTLLHLGPSTLGRRLARRLGQSNATCRAIARGQVRGPKARRTTGWKYRSTSS